MAPTRAGPHLALLAAVGLAYLLLALRVSPHGTTGDEPRYLLMAHSLVHDRDLNLANNVEARDYWPFHPGPLGYALMRPYGQPGAAYAVHYPGLAFVLAPGYAVGGRLGATLLLALVALGTAAVMAALAARAAGSVGPALVATGALALSFPLLFYAGQLFPETPAAALLAAGFLSVLRLRPPEHDGRLAVTLLAGAGLAFLPWLHAKFLVVLAALYALAALRWARSRRGRAHLVALLSPLAPSLAVMAVAYAAWYGNPWPTGPRPTSPLTLTYLGDGLLGVLADREYGLLIRAPVYGLALVALGVGAARAIPMMREVAVLFAAVWLLGATNADWWGGSSVPPRYLVPALPLLVVPLADALDRAGALARALAGALALASVAVALVAAQQSDLGLARATGTRESALLLRVQQAGPALGALAGGDLNDLLPSFVRAPFGFVQGRFLLGETGTTATDPLARTGAPRAAVAGRDRPGYVVSPGPNWQFRGPTSVLFRARVGDGAGEGPVVRLEAWHHAETGPRRLEARDLYRHDLSADRYADVPFRVVGPNGRDLLELRVYWYGAIDLAIDDVIIAPD